ncbi:hypothetical protein [Nonomuraea endophytica]|uniref:hypothetical protein n=1 Tax=Nonomuraea endophytica TaxID=714136 RepID=UPI0037C8A0AF
MYCNASSPLPTAPGVGWERLQVTPIRLERPDAIRLLAELIGPSATGALGLDALAEELGGIHEGLAVAKGGGVLAATPPSSTLNSPKPPATPARPRASVTSIAKLLGVSLGILCNPRPDLQELRVAQQGVYGRRSPGPGVVMIVEMGASGLAWGRLRPTVG